MYLQKRSQIKQYSCRCLHFLRTEIDSTDFKNENLTAKIRRNKAKKPYFCEKTFQKILKQKKPSNKIYTSKTIRQTNKSNKQLKAACYLDIKHEDKIK